MSDLNDNQTTLAALTIWQPWCSLIIAGAKTVEWRGWDYRQRRRDLVGKRIALHAGARPARSDEIADIIERIDDDETSLVGAIAKPVLCATHRLSWPLSSVLGTAVLGIPQPALEWVRLHATREYDSDRIDQHKWAWPLTEVERFDVPIPARGAQVFWTWRCA